MNKPAALKHYVEMAAEAVKHKEEHENISSMIGWLRHREGNDLVMMSGKMAKELADMLEKL